jgi:spore coat polysaccharide biosynthesis protein SpsF
MESMILGIVQARFSSSRLPGKVLKTILGKEMLWHQVNRIQCSKMIDKLVVATSNHGSDDSIEKMCKENYIECFRGDLNNVLDRFYQCALQYNPRHIVRLTGDCPLTDPGLIDETIEKHLETNSDYTSNCIPPSYPDGLDVEVVKFKALKKAWQFAKMPSELEHVMPYIRSHTEIFKNYTLTSKKDLSAHRWTVDGPEDFEFVEKIYLELFKKNKNFNMQDILNLLDKNDYLTNINYHIKRNEGAIKSYEQDKEFLKNV